MTNRTEKLLKASMDASRAQNKRKDAPGSSHAPPSPPPANPQEERRSKAKHGNEGLCKNASTLQKYQNSFKNRRVEFGKIVSFEFFDGQRIFIGNLFRAIGWEHFITLNNTCYPRLVRVFYANFFFTPDFEIESWVKGKPIDLTITTIATIFRLPKTNTIQSFNTHSWTIRRDFNIIAALKLICNDNTIQDKFLPSVNQLSVTSRIIHHIITYNLMPRSGSRSHVGYMDVYIIWCVLTGVKLDLAHIILHHTHDCAKKKTGVLPYGHALTSVFEAFGVTLDNEPEVYNAKHSDFYDEATLKRMKFIKDGNGNWIRDPQQAQQPPPEDEHDEDEPVDEPPHQQPLEEDIAPPTLQTVMTAIESLRVSMAQGFSSIDQRFNALEARLDRYVPPPPPDDED